MQFLIASAALILAMSGTAMAQTIPDKCQKLNVTDYVLEPDKVTGNLHITALVHNDDPYTLTNATFVLHFLDDSNVKVGQVVLGVTGLLPGETGKYSIFTSLKAITYIVVAGISCNFTR